MACNKLRFAHHKSSKLLPQAKNQIKLFGYICRGCIIKTRRQNNAYAVAKTHGKIKNAVPQTETQHRINKRKQWNFGGYLTKVSMHISNKSVITNQKNKAINPRLCTFSLQ